MKKKLYITRTVKIIALMLAVVSSVLILQGTVLRRIDQNSMRVEAFYLEDKGSVDVVLIGASDVYAGYSAPYAYDKYGITGYPYATQSSPPDVVLPQVKEVIKYQNPKMIIVELNSFLYTDRQMPNPANRRLFTDNIPRDEIWKDYIKENIEPDEQIEYYLPIIKYHSIWSDYPWRFKNLISDIKAKNRGYSLLRGYKTVARVFDPQVETINERLPDDDSTSALGSLGKKYLKELLAYLKENNIKNVVFARFPHIVREKNGYKRFCRANEAGNIIKEYGYDFINLERYAYDEGFVVGEDWYNWDHLNIFGTEKCTDYIAELLMEKYGVTPAELNEEQKASWEDSVDNYHKLYNYAQYIIESNPKTTDDKVKNEEDTLREDEESMRLLDEFAAEHPDFGKYASANNKK